MLERPKYIGEDAARTELGTSRSKPAWLQNQHSLPFQSLSDDEFEIFCYLLLCREHPEDNISYYGKTGDAGRDIVRIKKDGSIELIQCKRYQNNVGIGEIRTEIAKLYVNLHNQIILDRPNSVTFYVVPDLTSPAQDLINDHSKWIKIAELTLKEFLKKEPTKELLEFATWWYPNFSKQTAIDLTQRALKHEDLLEEFFAYKKVIDSDNPKLKAIYEMAQKILENQTISLQPKILNAPSELQALLHKAEEENPEIAFTATSNSYTTVFTIAAKANPVLFGTLVFPENEAGEHGKQKFTLAIEEGRPIELLVGEYDWKWGFKLPEVETSPLTLKTLHFCPNIPKVCVPIRLDILNNTEAVASVNFTYLRLVRAGTRELEFIIEGKQITGRITFISHLQDKKVSLFLGDIDLCAVRAAEARNTIAIMLALYKGGRLKITSLEDDAVLFEEIGVVTNSNYSEQNFEKSLEFLNYLIKINWKFDFDFDIRYPQSLDVDTVNTAKEIVTAIEKGKIEHSGGIYTPSYKRQEALEIIKYLKTGGPFNLSINAENNDYRFLGHHLSLGKSNTVLENIVPVEGLPALEQAVERLTQSEEIDIALKYDRATQSFFQWLPKAADEQPDPI